MERKKRQWLLGCAGGVLGLALLGGLTWLFWHRGSTRRKSGPVIEAMTEYRGLSAPMIEKSITSPIERLCNQLPGVRTITSRSLAGLSVVRVEFQSDVDPDVAFNLIEDNVRLGKTLKLPVFTSPSGVFPSSLFDLEPLGILVFSNQPTDEAALWSLAGIVCDQVGGLPGTVLCDVLGGEDSSVEITFDPNSMANRKVSLGKVLETLKQLYDEESVKHFLGLSLSINAYHQAIKIGDLNEVRVVAEDGEKVRLGDICTVKYQYHHDDPTLGFRIDSRRAVGVSVYLKRGASRKDGYKKLAEKLPSIRQVVEKSNAHLRWLPLAAEHKGLRETDDGLLKLFVRAPSEASQDETEERVAVVENFLMKTIPANEREAIVSEVGFALDWPIWKANAGPMDATILVQLSGDRTLSAAEYAAKLRRGLNDDPQFADLHVRFASRDMPAPVDIRVTSRQLAEDVRRQLAAVNGAVDVDIAQREDTPSIVLHVDRQKAKEVGLHPADVLRQALAALHAKGVDRYVWIDDDVIPEEVFAEIPPCPASTSSPRPRPQAPGWSNRSSCRPS